MPETGTGSGVTARGASLQDPDQASAAGKRKGSAKGSGKGQGRGKGAWNGKGQERPDRLPKVGIQNDAT